MNFIVVTVIVIDVNHPTIPVHYTTSERGDLNTEISKPSKDIRNLADGK